jgi:hypothetical protein
LIGLVDPAAELGVELSTIGEYEIMDKQAFGVGRNAAEPRALYLAGQVEVAVQAPRGELDTGKDALLSAEADLPLDWRIGDRSGGLDVLGKGVKEGDNHRRLAV